MRVAHISDLHLGKSINKQSLIEGGDQKHWIEEFLKMVEAEKIDVVMIAGDVYDRSQPSAEATALFDEMLTSLSKMGVKTLVIAGNHDSGVKLAFANRLLENPNIGVYIAGEPERNLKKVTFEDEYGKINFYLLPYIFPAKIQCFLEETIGMTDYNNAIKKYLEIQDINTNERNILIAHQNVVAAGKEGLRGGSESMVGGVGQVEYTVFDDFDYVALGHIHAAYPVGRENVRFAGSPLCYHFDEVKQAKKGPIILDIKDKASEIGICVKQIEPLHEMCEIKGTYEEICRDIEKNPHRNQYVKVTLTDRRMTPDIAMYLRTVFSERDSKLLENISTYSEFKALSGVKATEGKEKSIEEYFEELYRERKSEDGPDKDEADIINFIGEMVRDHISKGYITKDDGDGEKIIKYVIKNEKGDK